MKTYVISFIIENFYSMIILLTLIVLGIYFLDKNGLLELKNNQVYKDSLLENKDKQVHDSFLKNYDIKSSIIGSIGIIIFFIFYYILFN